MDGLLQGKIAELWSVWDGWLYNLQPFADDHNPIPDGWLPVPGSASTTPRTYIVPRRPAK